MMRCAMKKIKSFIWENKIYFLIIIVMALFAIGKKMITDYNDRKFNMSFDNIKEKENYSVNEFRSIRYDNEDLLSDYYKYFIELSLNNKEKLNEIMFKKRNEDEISKIISEKKISEKSYVTAYYKRKNNVYIIVDNNNNNFTIYENGVWNFKIDF